MHARHAIADRRLPLVGGVKDGPVDVDGQGSWVKLLPKVVAVAVQESTQFSISSARVKDILVFP